MLTVEDAKSSAPIFRAFDKSGRQISQHEFRIEGAQRINIYSSAFARGFDGSLAIAGSAYTNDTRGANFLAWVSPDGRKQTVTRISPYVTRVVTVAADGTIWRAGYEKDADGSVKSDYPMIRRFHSNGAVLNSLVLRSSLSTDVGYHTPTDLSFLVSSRDGRVGWHSESSRTYLEFSLDGKVIKQTPVDDLHAKDELRPKKIVLGIALCDSGGLFVSASWTPPSGGTKWGIYVRDEQRGEWKLVPRPEKWGMIYGCDGTTLAGRTEESSIRWLDYVGNDPENGVNR